MKLLDEFNVGWGARLPIVLQTEAAECGLACPAMVASYYGQRSDLATLRAARFGLAQRRHAARPGV
jgi:ATP-binding cassette subfamily B protein RaxB